MIKTRNRYVIASAGITLHLMIGGVYAWSVFTGPIVKQIGWAEASVSFAFSLAIFFLGMSVAFMGRLVEKFGPTSSVCYGLGVFLTGIAISNQQLWLLYLAYGVIGGLGLGAGYVTPVSTIIRWFPDKRGLATGLAIMGFGFAALLTGPIAQTLMASFGVSSTFYILGIFYFLVMIIAAQFIKKPRQNELPKAVIKKASHFSLTGQNMTANTAAIMVGILGLFNGAGFSVIPVYLGDVFSTRELGAIHGYVLTAWAAAGMVGPILLSYTHQILHNYFVTLVVFIVIDLLALIVSLALQRALARMQEQVNK
ncbi:MFS transporter [Lactobacillus amylovorus]|uniref:MFS transporter n=1 Tax=Lactobacillus amylovorus TaxID=1604 RepID=UPI00232E073F|nr:MFS transporter [Lactobacillus amylovorus]MDB6264521.1 MFS transporter [Lactobacillus amylovorus]